MESHLHVRASKFSTREPTAILQQKRNTTVNIIEGGCTKPTKPANTPKHNPWTSHCTSEKEIQIRLPLHRHTFHKTLTLEKGPIPPTKDSFHNTVEPQPSSLQKGDPNHNNRERIKWEINMQLVKIVDKNPPK